MDRQNAQAPFEICIESKAYPQRGLLAWHGEKQAPGSGPKKWQWAVPAGLAIALLGIISLWGGGPRDTGARTPPQMNAPLTPLSTQKENADAGLILLDIQTNQAAAAFHVSGPGVYVLSVSGGSPSHKAGIRPGDRILQMNDKPVTDATELLSLLNHLANGETASLTLRRGPDLVTVQFHAGAGEEQA